MSLTTPLIFQVHAVPESIALCWPASIEGQVLRAILSTKAFANVCKRDWLRIQDSRFKIPKKLLESRGQDQESFWIQEVFFES